MRTPFDCGFDVTLTWTVARACCPEPTPGARADGMGAITGTTGAVGVTGPALVLGPEIPPGPVAMALSVYDVPLVRPEITQVLAGEITVQDAPPGCATTVKLVAGPPPPPGEMATVIAPLPEMTDAMTGGEGAAAPGATGAPVATGPYPTALPAEREMTCRTPEARPAMSHVVAGTTV